MSSRPERGAAAVLGLALVGVVTTLALVAVAAAGVLVGRRRAAAAADLAALAGAAAVQRGQEGCTAAAHISELNTARLVECLVEQETVRVTVTVEVPFPFGVTRRVVSRARAGPLA